MFLAVCAGGTWGIHRRRANANGSQTTAFEIIVGLRFRGFHRDSCGNYSPPFEVIVVFDSVDLIAVHVGTVYHHSKSLFVCDSVDFIAIHVGATVRL